MQLLYRYEAGDRIKWEDTKHARQCIFQVSQPPALSNTLVNKCASAFPVLSAYSSHIRYSIAFNSIMQCSSSEHLSHVFYCVIVRFHTSVLHDSFMAFSVDGCEQRRVISVPWRNSASTSGYTRTHRTLICVQTHPCASRSWQCDTPGPLSRTEPAPLWKTLAGFGLIQVIQDRLVMSGKPIQDHLVQEQVHQLQKWIRPSPL